MRESEGKRREDGRKNFFHPLERDEVMGRGREFSSLSPSFVLSSYAHNHAHEEASKNGS